MLLKDWNSTSSLLLCSKMDSFHTKEWRGMVLARRKKRRRGDFFMSRLLARAKRYFCLTARPAIFLAEGKLTYPLNLFLTSRKRYSRKKLSVNTTILGDRSWK